MTRAQMTCRVSVSDDLVDAVAEMIMHATVSCAPACDLRGHTLLIKDQAGADTAKVEITHFDGETNETDEFVVKAPVKPGTYTWSAVCPAVVNNGVSYAEATTRISFTVKAHTTSVVAWDTPSAVVAGERFTTKVGIKCSSGCDLKDKNVGVYDHEGIEIATLTLSGDSWPGTTRLYFAEVELQAPAEQGLYTWSVKCPGSDTAIPHDEGFVDFGVRVVARPEYVVKIEAVDKESQRPLSDAHVVMHPYRAITNERGIAEVRVVKGAYRLFVSQTRYVTYGLPVEVSADMTARAELELEPVTERN